MSNFVVFVQFFYLLNEPLNINILIKIDLRRELNLTNLFLFKLNSSLDTFDNILIRPLRLSFHQKFVLCWKECLSLADIFPFLRNFQISF